MRILIQKFRTFDHERNVAAPWHNYNKIVKNEHSVRIHRHYLAQRLFVKAGDIELVTITVTYREVERCLNIKGANAKIK